MKVYSILVSHSYEIQAYFGEKKRKTRPKKNYVNRPDIQQK